MKKKNKEVLFAGFNQDNKCFSVGTDEGFLIYNTEPFRLQFERILEEEFVLVIMLYKTNIIALVGSENNTNYNSNSNTNNKLNNNKKENLTVKKNNIVNNNIMMSANNSSQTKNSTNILISSITKTSKGKDSKSRI